MSKKMRAFIFWGSGSSIFWLGLVLFLLVFASGVCGAEEAAEVRSAEEAARPGEAALPSEAGRPGHLAGEVLVGVEEALSEEEVRQVAAAVDAQVGRRLTPWGLYLFTFDERIPVSEVIRQLEGHPAVHYAEPNVLYEAFSHPSTESRWTSAASLSSAGTAAANGQPVIVAVLDTGIDPAHPAFAGRLYQNTGEVAGDGIDNDGNGYIDDFSGFDFYDHDADPTGGPGAAAHGTQVAGRILAGAVDASVAILPIRVGPGPGISLSAIIEGIEYAVNQGARIINMSFGSRFHSFSFLEAIQRASAQGVLLVAAAGNNGWYGSNYPAAYSQVVSVAASTAWGRKAWFSNYGYSVDFIAPGVNVTTTTWGGGTTSVSGTSFSAPFLSGVAARLLAARPNLANSQLLSTLRSFALNINRLNPFFRGLLGRGLINDTVAQRIAQAFPLPLPQPSGQTGGAPSQTGDAPSQQEASVLNSQLTQWRQALSRRESELSQAQQAWEAVRRQVAGMQNWLSGVQQQLRSQLRRWAGTLSNWLRLSRATGWFSSDSIRAMRQVQAQREAYLRLAVQEREAQQRLRVALAEERQVRTRHQEAQSRRDFARRQVNELSNRLASLQNRDGQARTGRAPSEHSSGHRGSSQRGAGYRGGSWASSSELERLLMQRNALLELLSLPHPIEELGGRESPEPLLPQEKGVRS